MKNRLLEIIIGISILLILILFDPYIFPGLYIDSTGNFTFIALTKILLLGVLNTGLSLFWTYITFRDKKAEIIYTKAFIPILLFLLASIFTALSSTSKWISLFGYNFVLNNSLIEIISLIIFFFLIINLIKTKEQIYFILRFFLSGICLSIIYNLIRYSTTEPFGINLLQYYINNVNFTLVGNQNSLLILSIIGFVISSAFLINDHISETSRSVKIFDYILISILGIGSGVLLNINSNNPQYIFLGLIILFLGLITYLLISRKRLHSILRTTLIFLIVPLLVGIGINYFYTSSKAQPSFYPSSTLANDWQITLSSLNSTQKIFFGNGQGSYANMFDKYSNDDFYQNYTVNDKAYNNFVVTSQSPGTEEARKYESSSFILGLIIEEGILGLITFISIIIYVLYLGLSRNHFEEDIIGLFSFGIFIGLSIFLFIVQIDFILLLTFWIFLAVFFINTKENYRTKKLFTLNALSLPSVIALISITGLWLIIPLITANYHVYNAKVAQLNADKLTLLDQSNLAVNNFPYSDLFLRENVFAKNVYLFEKYNSVNSGKNSNDINSLLREIPDDQNDVISELERAIDLNPNEYKNYYFAGLTLSNASEFTSQLNFDTSASKYLNNAISRNPNHADSYYQLAKIYLRQGQPNAALNSITEAISLRQQNLQYIEFYADVLKANGNYQDALDIYSKIKEVKDSNPSNQQLQNFYQNQNIDKDIEEVKKKIQEGNK